MDQNIRVYDVSINSVTKISSDGSSPDIYGSYIVYTKYYSKDHKNDGIYLYDFNNLSENKIATVHGYPAIYNKTVVWSQANNSGGYDICMYDISTNQTSTITTTNSSNFYLEELDIYGNVVVWTESHNVYMYDIATHKITPVTNSGNAYEPAIYGNRIVYTYDPRGIVSGDIYMYEISTAKTIRITTSTSAFGPSIYKDKIVYADSKNSEYGDLRDIYFYDLTSTVQNTPVAEFTSNITYGTAPLVVRFTDTSIGGVPTSWYWNTGDSISSKHAMNATHTFTKPGMYNVTLTVANEAGNSTVTKPNYINVTSPAPVADFSTNLTSGTAPLTVLFADTSKGEAPTSWYWDFGDSTNSTDSVVIHTFMKPRNYTISLTVGNNIGNNTTTRLSYIIVTDPNIPVTNFSSNVTEGYAPLIVQFNDISQKATSRIWDFNGDGKPDSSDINPIYIYSNPGIYIANLTESNENGTISKTTAINVLTPSSSSGGSSEESSGGSSNSGSSSSSGSTGSSPELQNNVQVKEISQAFVASGKTVKFDFTKNATCVMYVSFNAKKTFGKTTAIAEQLKRKSILVSGLPSEEVYRFFNVWVGNGGIATSKNIENPVICFKVEKAWIKDKKINPDSITLNRYSDKKWEQFPVNLSRQDDKFLYFTTETSGFSSFAITGTVKPEETVTKIEVDYPETINENNTENKEPQAEQKEILKTSGFEVYSGVISLLAVLLYLRK
jgi:PGF-pre-PGF domain-containing protein